MNIWKNLKKTTMNKLTFITLLVGLNLSINAQDSFFSVSDQIQPAINPAFTGVSKNLRVSATSRIQWPNSTYNNIATNFFADQYLGSHSVGIQYTYYSTFKIQQTNNFKANYAFEKKLKKGNLRAGIGLGMIYEYLDVSKIQYGMEDTYNYPSFKANVSKFDMDGGVLYQREKFYVGYSVLHLTNPDLSHVRGGGWHRTICQSLQMGKRFDLGDDDYLMIGTYIYYQEYFSNASFFVQNKYKWLITGIGYRDDNVVFGRIGVAFDSFRILYNYDYSISPINYFNGKASHEVALQGYFNTRKKVNERPLFY